MADSDGRSRRKRRSPQGKAAAAYDVRLGLMLGLAATGVAAGVWAGGLAGTGDTSAAGTPAVPVSVTQSNAAGGEAITIHVRATGTLRWMLGSSQVDIQVPEGTTVAGLSDSLAGRYPNIDAMAMITVSGSTDTMMPLDEVLADGERVDLVAGMAGG